MAPATPATPATPAKKKNIQPPKNKGKKKVSKPSLCIPYNLHWPPVENEVEIIEKLESMLTSGVNVKAPVVDKENRRDKKKRQEHTEEQLKQRTTQETNLRSQIVIGANAVSRSAEKDLLRLVVVDRTSPWQLHKPLLQLCALRGCPAVAVNGLSDRAPAWLNVRICAVMGFKKLKEGDDPLFTGSLEQIFPLIPQGEPLSWLQTETVNTEDDNDEDDDEEDDDSEEDEDVMEEDQEEQKFGRNKTEHGKEVLKQSKPQEKESSEKTVYKKENIDVTNQNKPLKGLVGNFVPMDKPSEPNENRRNIKVITGLAGLEECIEKYRTASKDASRKQKRKHKDTKVHPVKKTKYISPNVGVTIPQPNKEEKKKGKM